MNFHSSTVSSNLLLIISEAGASISANVVGGSSLYEKQKEMMYILYELIVSEKAMGSVFSYTRTVYNFK